MDESAIEGPAYWTIRIGEGQTKEATTYERAVEIYKNWCTRTPDMDVTLCEVWIKPIMERLALPIGDKP